MHTFNILLDSPSTKNLSRALYMERSDGKVFHATLDGERVIHICSRTITGARRDYNAVRHPHIVAAVEAAVAAHFAKEQA